MKRSIQNIIVAAALLLVAVLPIGCTKDYTDPTRATEDQVFSTARGLTGVVVGLQRVYTLGRASNLYNRITVNGLTTNELIVVNSGNTAEVQLAAGGNLVDGNNSILTTFWTISNKIIYDADRVLSNAPNLPDKGYASGLIAYAAIFKALAIGDLAEFWEKVPAGIGVNITFIDRIEGYKKAIATLDAGLAAVAANPISSAFISNVPAGIDIVNTLNALKARFSVFSGQYAQALTAANAVDLSKKSVFSFDLQSLNPLYEVATSTNNVVQPIDSTLGLLSPMQPALNDGRVPFYTSINVTIAPRYRIAGFGATAVTVIPVYLPGEMTLIKAEAYARQSPPDLNNALIELNKVITKTNDPFGVNANQPPVNLTTQDDILNEIYRQRCIELFMSGLKLEDMRRFGRPTSERRRNLMPYPLRERDNNPNTPTDPVF